MYPCYLAFIHLSNNFLIYFVCSMCVYMCSCMYLWKPEPGIKCLPQFYSILSEGEGDADLSLNPELICSTQLAEQGAVSASHGVCCCSEFIYRDAGDLNWGPYACLASPLPTKPFPNLSTFVFNYLFAVPLMPR